MTRSRELVLHAGMGKTGTSSIQFFLRDNREELLRRGVLLPLSAGRARHAKLGLWAKDDHALTRSPEWQRMKASEPSRFRRRFHRQLLNEVADSGASRVLMSDEIVFMQPPDVLRRLRILTDELAERLRLVVYLRRQDAHMVSRYQQGVKIGWTQRLAEWSTEDMSDLYDYAARLRLHRRLLEPAVLVVRRYEPARFVGGDLVTDFLDACAVDAVGSRLVRVPDRNVSLDADTVEFLRLLNIHRVRTEGASPGLIDNRAAVSRLAEASDGPTLSLPREQLEAWRAQWARSDRAVAEEFFPGDPGPGQGLFDDSSPARPTVTRQELGPERIDELAALLGLPDPVRLSLRQLGREGT